VHDHCLIVESLASAKRFGADGIEIIGFAATDPTNQWPHGKRFKIGSAESKTKVHR